ncbi:MAG TPA: CBS domain-containing protein, partial [Marmoricola sp.]|nr:CBS domain-containing protein [Marmoricola sp.]
MSTTPTRVFAARLTGLPVFDPKGDQVGKVRDVVVVMRTEVRQPRVVGLVVEVFGRRQIFVPMTRVISIDSGSVITTGLLNMRRFAQRSTETLVIAQMLDRAVRVRATGAEGIVYDVAMEQARTRDWVLSRVALTEKSKGFRRRAQTHVLEWDEVDGLHRRSGQQGATNLIATLSEMKPADAANAIHDLPDDRRTEVVAAMDDERLAGVLEELPEEDQVEILTLLKPDRAADVLEEMSADDAADLIADLPQDLASRLLELMEADEAEDVKRLMLYGEETAGGMMTPEPVVLPPDATVAEALAHVRNKDLTPSLAAVVYVCRPPLETPTGRFLGMAHIQRLLREPPSTLVAGIVDSDTDQLRPEASMEDVAIFLATYNLVAAPVVDEDGHLLGAVTVDDLLDHLLPVG